MKIFTCKDRLEDIMTCIYDAWSEALLIGHDQIQLKKEPVFQQTIFDEYIHVDQDLSCRIQNWRECTTAICESTCDANIRIAS